MPFQSRNRDAFRFKQARCAFPNVVSYLFQSRNRDAFRFKRAWDNSRAQRRKRFNLGIEMLFVSSCMAARRLLVALRQVSISESRCFSFQENGVARGIRGLTHVSISESRCFSFQAPPYDPPTSIACSFQSRNRDAFRFKRGAATRP